MTTLPNPTGDNPDPSAEPGTFSKSPQYSIGDFSTFRTQTATPASIDKLHLSTAEPGAFVVHDDASLTIDPEPFHANTDQTDPTRPLFLYASGRVQYGRSATTTTPSGIWVNITRDVFGSTAGLPRIRLHWNPNKSSHPYLPTTSTSEMHAQISRISDDVRQVGVTVDMSALRIDRLDAMRQAHQPRPFTAYAQTLTGLPAWVPGQRIAPNRTKNPTSIAWKNANQELCAYCKGTEMRMDLNNLMRMEGRALKNEAVARLYGPSTLDDLRGLHLDDLNDAFCRYLLSGPLSRPSNPITTMPDFESIRHHLKESGQIDRLDAVLLVFLLRSKANITADQYAETYRDHLTPSGFAKKRQTYLEAEHLIRNFQTATRPGPDFADGLDAPANLYDELMVFTR